MFNDSAKAGFLVLIHGGICALIIKSLLSQIYAGLQHFNQKERGI